MKCDRCGCQFAANEAQTESRNEATGAPGRLPYTDLVTNTICPTCASSRHSIRRFVYWLAAVVVLAVALAALVRWQLG